MEPLPVVSRLRQYLSRHGYHSRRRLYVQRHGCHKSLVEWQAWKLGTSVVWGRTSNMEPSTPITDKKTKARDPRLCETFFFWFCSITYCIELERVNKVAKKKGDGAVKGELCYAKEMLLWLPLQIMVRSAHWTMTINIVSSVTVLSGDNSAVI